MLYREFMGRSYVAAQIMNAKELWNHNALFDYMDRYMATEKDWRQWSALASNMYDTYRKDYVCYYVALDTATHQRIYENCDSTQPDPFPDPKDPLIPQDEIPNTTFLKVSNILLKLQRWIPQLSRCI